LASQKSSVDGVPHRQLGFFCLSLIANQKPAKSTFLSQITKLFWPKASFAAASFIGHGLYAKNVENRIQFKAGLYKLGK